MVSNARMLFVIDIYAQCIIDIIFHCIQDGPEDSEFEESEEEEEE